MPVYNSGSDIFHTEGGREVWSTVRRPAQLLPAAAVTLSNFDIVFPDLAKSNAYGFDIGTDFVGFQATTCMSMASINPQEWDSGTSFVCNLPSSANYFEVEVNLTRVVNPSSYLGLPIPKTLREGQRHMLDGGSAIAERIGPLVRMFSFEKAGSTVVLRRKQSVAAPSASLVPWTPGNALYYPSGGWREGWTYDGNALAWPAHILETKGPGGALDKKRDGANRCSLTDTSNYASTWRGTVTITPGFIQI